MFMHYKWVKIEIANRRFFSKSENLDPGNGAQVLDFTLKKSEVQHPLYFTFLPLDFTLKNKKKPLDFTAESVLFWKISISNGCATTCGREYRILAIWLETHIGGRPIWSVILTLAYWVICTKLSSQELPFVHLFC